MLNPEADPSELEAELIDDLVILLEEPTPATGRPVPHQRPALELVRGRSGDEAREHPASGRAAE